MVLLEQGRQTEAMTSFDKALEINPQHESALLNSAILLQELGGAEFRRIARERLLRLLVKDRTFFIGRKKRSAISFTSTNYFREQRESPLQLGNARNGRT